MALQVQDAAPTPDPTPRLASLLFAFAGLCFILVGGLLWWQDGAMAVRDFAILVWSWCF
jgi:hypothetical protein